ncbi:iron ABC transporter permease [Anaerolineales bacterium]
MKIKYGWGCEADSSIHIAALGIDMQGIETSQKPRAFIKQRLSQKQRTPLRRVILRLICFILIGIVVLPILYLGIRALSAGDEAIDYLLKPRTLTIMANSIALMVSVMVSACLIGVPFAYLTTRSDLYFRRVWLILGLLTMVIPSYLGAATFLEMFGMTGMLAQALAPLGIDRLLDIRGFGGTWIVMTLFTYPFVVLPVRSALIDMDPALEEAARSLGLGPWAVFRRVTLAQLRPAITAGLTLTALYALSDFGIVAMMRFNAFTRAIYLNYTSSFNREQAAVLALVLIGVVMILLQFERFIASSHQNYKVGTGTKRKTKQVKLGKWQLPALLFTSLLAFLGVGVPVLVLANWLTGRTMIDAVPVAMTELASNTVSVSIATAIVVAISAIPLALLATRGKTRFDRWVIQIGYAGNVLPGLVIALAMVFFAANYLPEIYQSAPLLIIGYSIRYLPLSIGATRSSLSQINPRLEEAARSMGVGPWRTLWRITFPLARTGIIAGAVLVFLNVMRELPITLMLSPIGFRTFANRIWSVYGEGMLVLIGQPGLVLLGVSGLVLLLLLWRDKHLSQ